MAVGWYIFIDGLVQAAADCVDWGNHFNPNGCSNASRGADYLAPPGLQSGAYWTPGILSTVGLIGLNIINWDAVTEDFDSGLACKARMWVTTSFVLMFCGLGAAIWILVLDLQLGPQRLELGPQYYHWGGVSVMIQTVLILIGGFLFRISRRGGDHGV